MTANLVNYWRYREDARHNLVAEQQTDRSIAETIRHNRVVEAETNRHNVASEGIEKSKVTLGYAQLAETTRHNKASELATVSYNQELARHNLATELRDQFARQETARHNKALETLESRKVFTSQRQQDLREQQFELDKTKYVTDTYLSGFNTVLGSAKTITDTVGKLGRFGK